MIQAPFKMGVMMIGCELNSYTMSIKPFFENVLADYYENW